ncbi:cytochrome b5 [Chloropicon primus]|uniref:Cytochrome b5 n=1 Tax=Chloropicon primus TaxID=1764295 RepID=A0A5B8MEM7_9CHLO|nr:cytochrome b5 [Chloropicon primus]UPQ98044.1 cytochrome b5 [Chloropicon primus]|mmetsp:Transcript_3734/g.10685  ORF Transcript_3734/g.10685 Transcript_3734/m.10685 type:complete len:142 (-) Transcript_3734:74-499(-)|eukprot:QDZ18837.1 cytochrome b5 [Chloropicon primus]
MTATKVYTLEECKKHNTYDDCWIIMFGKVYDVTKFLDDHPGGGEIIVDVTGRDATEDFEDVVHSATARKQLEGLVIGDLHEDDKKRLRSTGGIAASGASGASSARNGAPSPVVTFIKAILPFVLVALAYLYQKSKASSPQA